MACKNKGKTGKKKQQKGQVSLKVIRMANRPKKQIDGKFWCPSCELFLERNNFDASNGRVWTNISIDRIDSNASYSEENCALCCCGFNLMKTNLSLESLEILCIKFIEKRKQDKTEVQ